MRAYSRPLPPGAPRQRSARSLPRYGRSSARLQRWAMGNCGAHACQVRCVWQLHRRKRPRSWVSVAPALQFSPLARLARTRCAAPPEVPRKLHALARDPAHLSGAAGVCYSSIPASGAEEVFPPRPTGPAKKILGAFPCPTRRAPRSHLLLESGAVRRKRYLKLFSLVATGACVPHADRWWGAHGRTFSRQHLCAKHGDTIAID